MGLGGLGCGTKCIKILLFVFNFIFWLCGAALIGLGVWLIVDTGSLSKHFDVIDAIGDGDNDNALKIVSYVFIAVGALIFIIGFCGCCGAIKEIRCLLGLYIAFMVLIIAAQVACVVLGFIYKGTVKEMVDDKARDFFMNKYLGNATASYSMRFIEHELKCCAMNGPGDYKGAKYGRVSEWCCSWEDSDFIEDVPKPDNPTVCTVESTCYHAGLPSCGSVETHTEGCLDKILDYYPYFIGVALAIAIFELIGIIFAACLCQAIGKEI